MTNTIHRGDHFPIVVSWFIPGVDNPLTESDAVISAATVRVVRLRDNAIVVDDEPAIVDGNETLFTVDPEHLQIAGPYAAFVQAEFNDGLTRTQRIDFHVTYRR